MRVNWMSLRPDVVATTASALSQDRMQMLLVGGREVWSVRSGAPLFVGDLYMCISSVKLVCDDASATKLQNQRLCDSQRKLFERWKKAQRESVEEGGVATSLWNTTNVNNLFPRCQCHASDQVTLAESFERSYGTPILLVSPQAEVSDASDEAHIEAVLTVLRREQLERVTAHVMHLSRACKTPVTRSAMRAAGQVMYRKLADRSADQCSASYVTLARRQTTLGSLAALCESGLFTGGRFHRAPPLTDKVEFLQTTAHAVGRAASATTVWELASS